MARTDFASFIWKSRLYVIGGKKTLSDIRPRGEVWSLNLKKSKNESWQREADYPDIRKSFFIGWKMVVYREKAWLVTGERKVDYLDLNTRKWGSISTTFARTSADQAAGLGVWPWQGALREYAVQAAHGKLYVFGGTDRQTGIGNNLFMELDLETKKWKRLTGYPKPTADYTMPGPRRYASAWVNKDDSKMYLTFGDANRCVHYLDTGARTAT